MQYSNWKQINLSYELKQNLNIYILREKKCDFDRGIKTRPFKIKKNIFKSIRIRTTVRFIFVIWYYYTAYLCYSWNVSKQR